MSDFRKYISLLESAETGVLLEGRHDDLMKQTYTSVDNIISKIEDEELLHKLSNITKLYKTTHAEVKKSTKEMPNKWKYFAFDVLRQSLLQALINAGVDDKKLQRKIKINKLKGNHRADVLSVVSPLIHFSSIDYPPIQNYDPNQNPENFVSDMEELEQEWKEMNEDWIIPNGNEKVILDLGKYKWVDLGRGGCRDEGEAMGHCGNVPSRKPGDTIYSLRQIKTQDGEEYHRPSLTFIANDGILGEMKGRGNDKPSEKYHPHIVELLKSKYVTGLKGGGYMPENNFHPDDLTEEERNSVIEVKGEDFFDMSGLANLRKIMKEYHEGKANESMVVATANEIIENAYSEGDIEDDIQLSGFMNDSFVVDVEFMIDSMEPILKYFTGDEFLDIEPSSIKDIDIDFIFKNLKSGIQHDIISFIDRLINDDEDVKEELYDIMGLDVDDEEHDLDDIRSNIEDIIKDSNDSTIEEIADTFARGEADGESSGIQGEMLNDIKSHIDTIAGELYLVSPENVFELIDNSPVLPIKNNDVVGYVENILSGDPELENFEMDSRGYSGYDHVPVLDYIHDYIYEIDGMERNKDEE